MALSIFAYLNGVSALFLTFWGISNFVRYSLYYVKEKKKLQPIVALLGITRGVSLSVPQCPLSRC